MRKLSLQTQVKWKREKCDCSEGGSATGNDENWQHFQHKTKKEYTIDTKNEINKRKEKK